VKYAIRLINRTSVLVSLAVGVAICTAGVSGLLAPFERPAGDLLVRLAATFPPPTPYQLPDVAVVAIDARSAAGHRGEPLSSDCYAEAIRKLEAAGVWGIALDLTHHPLDDPKLDRALMDAIEGSGRIVLGVDPIADLARKPSSVPAHLRDKAAGLGVVTLSPDVDGVVRTAPRSARGSHDKLPSLATAALSVAGAKTTSPAAAREFPIDFRRTRPRFPVISLVDLLDERFDPGSVAGRVVFLGPTAPAFGATLLATPLGVQESPIFIHAHAYRTLVAEHSGEGVPLASNPWHSWLIAGIFSLALGSIVGLSRFWRIAILSACGLGLAFGSFALAVLYGVLSAPIVPALVWASHCMLATDGLRRRLGLRADPEDLSVAVVEGVCELNNRALPEGGRELELPLSLLGEAVGATGVSLVCCASPGMDGIELNWRPGLEDEFRCPQVGSLGMAQQVARRGEVEFCEEPFPGASHAFFKPTAVLYLPLRSGETTVGVLIVEGEGRTPFEQFELRTISGVAAQLALSLRYRSLLGGLQTTFSSAWTALARAIEARDGYVEIHTPRMITLTGLIAQKLGLSDEMVSAVQLGALLHDIGKIGIRDSVLNKPDPFTPEERREMERHPLIGADLVGSIHGLPKATLECIRHHHESWDGSGYPDGLAGNDIPLSARIACVVDVWDAMQSSRPYKPLDERESVFEYFEKYRGVRFDPEIVDIFLALLVDDEEGMSSSSFDVEPSTAE